VEINEMRLAGAQRMNRGVVHRFLLRDVVGTPHSCIFRDQSQ